MNYPLHISFKAIALSNQGTVTDASENVIAYVKQKAFKLKEAITVYTDKSQATAIATIKANKIIDFNAQYFFADMDGQPLGSVKRAGARSLWKADYTVLDASETPMLKINEEKGWVKFVDALVGEIPVVGIFTGYMFNPSYIVTRPDGTEVARIKKRPAMLEGKFDIDKLSEIAPDEEMRFLLGCFTSIMLERFRG